jgi:hypothetical protein
MYKGSRLRKEGFIFPTGIWRALSFVRTIVD